jgi:hypothetical protein
LRACLPDWKGEVIAALPDAARKIQISPPPFHFSFFLPSLSTLDNLDDFDDFGHPGRSQLLKILSRSRPSDNLDNYSGRFRPLYPNDFDGFENPGKSHDFHVFDGF